jgi:hypothetical protein
MTYDTLIITQLRETINIAENMVPFMRQDMIQLLEDAKYEIETLTDKNKDLLWMLDKRRSSPDCADLNHDSKHQNHGDICPVLTQYNTLAQKYGV